MPARVKQVRLQRHAGADLSRADLVQLALWGPVFADEAPITAAEWEDVRAETWSAWRAARAAGRHGDYPPDGAQRHDGLQGESVRTCCANMLTDRRFVTEHVPQDLAALQAFRRAHPEAAKAIARELRMYARALRTRLADHDAVWSAKMATATMRMTVPDAALDLARRDRDDFPKEFSNGRSRE